MLEGQLSGVSTLDTQIKETGPRGYSAYEVYVKNGGTLSEEEWLGSLKGDKGEKGDAGSIKFIIANELPTEDIDDAAIYMLPSPFADSSNTYEEYIYVNGVWESLGSASVEVNMDDYPTKEEVKAITGELENLVTEDKTNLVNAINEAMNSGGVPTIEVATVNASFDMSVLTSGLYMTGANYCYLDFSKLYSGGGTSKINIAPNSLVLFQNGQEKETNRGFSTRAFVIDNYGAKIQCWTNTNGRGEETSYTLNQLSKINTAQTISGKKTFSVLPETSKVPTTDTQMVNKKYVDDKTVTLTQAEYDALTTKNENTYYYIVEE